MGSSRRNVSESSGVVPYYIIHFHSFWYIFGDFSLVFDGNLSLGVGSCKITQLHICRETVLDYACPKKKVCI